MGRISTNGEHIIMPPVRDYPQIVTTELIEHIENMIYLSVLNL